VAWTVTGVLGFVLALMCSGRVVQRARQRRRQQVTVGSCGGPTVHSRRTLMYCCQESAML
jgi:hypothetical protein